MLKKSNVENEYKKKIAEIKKHNKFYFERDNTKITDAEYDTIKKEIIDLENKFPFQKIILQ